MQVNTRNGIARITVEAVVIRADGTVENLGEISFYDKNPLARFKWKVSQFIRKLKGGR